MSNIETGLSPHGVFVHDVFAFAPEALIVIDPYSDKVKTFNQAAKNLWFSAGFDCLTKPVSFYFNKSLGHLICFTELVFNEGKGLTEDISLVCADLNNVIDLEITATVPANDLRCLCLCLRDKKNHDRWRFQMRAQRHQTYDGLEWKRFEEVFQNIEKNNQLILSAAGEGIYGVDADGKATFINPAAERILGWRKQDVIGKNVHSLIHHSHEDGSHYHASACPIYAAFKDGEVRKESGDIFWSKSGQAIHVDYTSTPIVEHGRPIGAVVVFRDVSDRIQAEKTLQTAWNEIKQLKKQLELENAYLQEEINAEYNFHQIIGNSPAINTVIEQVKLVSPTQATVLITGESGTGKELIARAIHASSERSYRPLVRVNCAAISHDLFESEFFGHVKGAFSGALQSRVGRFALANGGTLFLDEVGEIPITLQSKLLRVLQDNEFERVGESQTQTVDVRVIAATNRNLEQQVKEGLFREDLFFRLNVFPIVSAPLRDRLDDIPLLVSHFIKIICKRLNKPDVHISVMQVEYLKKYTWPGNIRELENYLERKIILSAGKKLEIYRPPSNNIIATQNNFISLDTNIKTSLPDKTFIQSHLLTDDEHNKIMIQTIETALRHTNGKIYGKKGAAVLLNIKPTTLSSRIKRYKINAKIYKNG